jgi:hypothetical protein
MLFTLFQIKVAHAPVDKVGKFWETHKAGSPNYDIELSHI